MSTRALLLALLTLALLGPSAPSPAVAAGGDDSPMRGPAARPEDAEYAAAVTAIKAGDFAGAIRRLEGVVARDGTNADAYNWLAYAIRKNGDPARSIPLYQKALALDPSTAGPTSTSARPTWRWTTSERPKSTWRRSTRSASSHAPSTAI